MFIEHFKVLKAHFEYVCLIQCFLYIFQMPFYYEFFKTKEKAKIYPS